MATVSWATLGGVLLDVADRAARVARRCRADADLLHQLVVQKEDSLPRAGLAVDVKSLADVLIQQMVVRAIADLDPALGERVYGEESSRFAGANGAEALIQVGATESATRACLGQVLGGRLDVAADLASAVHGAAPPLTAEDAARLASLADVRVRPDALACWVDPIDGTNEYVKGGDGRDVPSAQGLTSGGLAVALILVGVYDRASGEPLFGVVHQPFHRRRPRPCRSGPTNEDDEWDGRAVWGGSVCGGPPTPTRIQPAPVLAKMLALLSSAEAPDVRERLEGAGFAVATVAGCGYKLLAVVDGLASVFVLTQPTTYCWDTCAVDAILRALGGGIVDTRGKLLNYGVAMPAAPGLVLHETAVAQAARHHAGLVAFRDPAVMAMVLPLLSDRAAPCP